MINPSVELCAVVRRTLKAARELDAETLRGIYSKDPSLRYVGSELDEVFGGEVFRKGVLEHLAEIPRYRQIEESLEAYESDRFGWALWQGVSIFPTDGEEVHAQYRISFVFVLEDGSWKIIQVHVSNPDSKFEGLGFPNEAMKALEEAARDEELGLGTTGTASIMFTDVVNSARLASLMGDRLWTQSINAHIAQVRQIVLSAGGTLVKSLGDGTMSTFRSTHSALAAARDIQTKVRADHGDVGIRLRVGIHTGEVIENKGDFFGTVVNKAARVAAAAHPDEIRVSDATRAMIGGQTEFAFGDPIRLPLKGLTGEHVLYRLEWQT